MPSMAVPKARQTHTRVGYSPLMVPGDRCDFCSARAPIVSFPAKPFSITVSGGETITFAEPWGACGPCALDVNNRRWDAIVSRHIAYELQRLEPGRIDHDALQDMRADAHLALRAFQEHRDGPEQASQEVKAPRPD